MLTKNYIALDSIKFTVLTLVLFADTCITVRGRPILGPPLLHYTYTYSYNCNRIMHVSFEHSNYISWPLLAGYRNNPSAYTRKLNNNSETVAPIGNPFIYHSSLTDF